MVSFPTCRVQAFLVYVGEAFFGLTFAALAVMAPTVVNAGVFSVSPVRMYMVPKDRAIAVTITNEGEDALVMQADVYVWRQKPGGEDELSLTEDMILSPPILKLAPHSRQVVRLAMLRARPTIEQLTYRLIVREVPEAKPTEKNLQLQLALAFSLTVFITPPSARHQLDCAIERVHADTVQASCENTGNAYVQLNAFTLTSADGEKLALRESGGYILPLIKRNFDIKRTNGPIPGSKAKLLVLLDDGSKQSFDVSIPD